MRCLVNGIDEQYDLHVIKICTMSEFNLKYEHRVADVNICTIPDSICPKSKEALNVNEKIDLTSCEDQRAVKLVDLPFKSQNLMDNDTNVNKKKRKKKSQILVAKSNVVIIPINWYQNFIYLYPKDQNIYVLVAVNYSLNNLLKNLDVLRNSKRICYKCV